MVIYAWSSRRLGQSMVIYAWSPRRFPAARSMHVTESSLCLWGTSANGVTRCGRGRLQEDPYSIVMQMRNGITMHECLILLKSLLSFVPKHSYKAINDLFTFERNELVNNSN